MTSEEKRKYACTYYAKNREKVLEANRQWKANNPEKALDVTRRWRANNPEKVREQSRQWRANNPEKARAKDRRNPEKKLVRKHRRRARGLKTSGCFTVEQFKSLCAHFKNHCLKCGEPRKLTPDHVIPLSWADRPEFDGVALNDIDNLQPLCGSCNCVKNAKHVDYRTNPHRNCINRVAA